MSKCKHKDTWVWPVSGTCREAGVSAEEWCGPCVESALRDADRYNADLRAEVEALKGQVYIGEHEFPDLTWKARCEETVSDLRASRAESDYLRAVVQNVADEPCRKLLLYHDTTCPEEYADRTKWCLACRARVALEEMRSHEAR